ncbi:aminodeoxychorismate/anthranilate synthase component II [Xanthobacter sp. VNH20]|uniref:anthranilate synthase component II n=1 Tax=Xanthobacter sp. VNH20 TaxID=3156616 RepID=UPI0032B5CF4C
MTAVTLIDNYDSFTYNLVHYLGELGANVTVHRNDALSVEDVLAEKPDAIVISPGPCTPTEAGICCDLIARASTQVPLFGVCLGHQAIGQVFGGDVVRAPIPMHGKMSQIHHEGRSVFRGLNHSFLATRYHSLIVEQNTLPDALEVTARTEDGLIMGLAHRTLPVHGVQFHPESIASENGHALLRNFLEIARAFNASRQGRS